MAEHHTPDTKRDLEPFVDGNGQIREDVFKRAVSADEFVARIRRAIVPSDPRTPPEE